MVKKEGGTFLHSAQTRAQLVIFIPVCLVTKLLHRGHHLLCSLLKPAHLENTTMSTLLFTLMTDTWPPTTLWSLRAMQQQWASSGMTTWLTERRCNSWCGVNNLILNVGLWTWCHWSRGHNIRLHFLRRMTRAPPSPTHPHYILERYHRGHFDQLHLCVEWLLQYLWLEDWREARMVEENHWGSSSLHLRHCTQALLVSRHRHHHCILIPLSCSVVPTLACYRISAAIQF